MDVDRTNRLCYLDFLKEQLVRYCTDYFMGRAPLKQAT
jgi:hypothetical protein